MPFYTARLTDGSTVEFDGNAGGTGAEKVAFFSRDRRQVILLYQAGVFAGGGSHRDTRLMRRRRLDRILTDRNPTVGAMGDYWKGHYCWPTGIIDAESGIPQSLLAAHNLLNPAFGIVTPVYPENFFFTDVRGSRREKNALWFTGTTSRRLVPKDELGNFLGYLQVCTRTARAMRRLHLAGLAHSDLSNKNVLIDPRRGGACVIDVDTLVVPGLAPPAVYGTPGYIAPEVVAEKIMPDGKPAQPCIATDRYALGVLIYENLLHRHPIRRQRQVRPNLDLSPEDDQRLAMGECALFTEHPANRENWHVPTPEVRLEHMGSFLRKTFMKLFIDGLHEPELRPQAQDWERALYRTFDLIHPSPVARGENSNWFILEAPEHSNQKVSMRCPFTKRSLTAPVPYARFFHQRKGEVYDEKRTLTIWNGLRLQKWHAVKGYAPDENADRTPMGSFVFHEGRWLFVNQAGRPMTTGDGRAVLDKNAVEIKPGLQLRVCEEENGRVLAFDFMHP